MLINKTILFAAEVAALLGYSTQYVYTLIHQGKLFAYKDPDGKAWRIPEKSITDYIPRQSAQYSRKR